MSNRQEARKALEARKVKAMEYIAQHEKRLAAARTLDAYLIIDCDFDEADPDNTYITIQCAGFTDTRGPLMAQALPEDLLDRPHFWCDALRFKGECEVVAEEDLIEAAEDL